MNEIRKVQMTGWADMVHQQKESGLTIKNWCQENGISEGMYYYRLKKLREAAIDSVSNNQADTGCFVKIPQTSPTPASDVALRIMRGDTVIEVAGNASDSILSFLKDVMTNAV